MFCTFYLLYLFIIYTADEGVCNVKETAAKKNQSLLLPAALNAFERRICFQIGEAGCILQKDLIAMNENEYTKQDMKKAISKLVSNGFVIYVNKNDGQYLSPAL